MSVLDASCSCGTFGLERYAGAKLCKALLVIVRNLAAEAGEWCDPKMEAEDHEGWTFSQTEVRSNDMHGLEQHVLPDTGARVGNPCLGCFIVRWVSGGMWSKMNSKNPPTSDIPAGQPHRLQPLSCSLVSSRGLFNACREVVLNCLLTLNLLSTFTLFSF